jgi:hypothetical protein
MKALLYAPEDYWTTPERILNEIAHGCGPGWFGNKLVPDKLLGLSIKDACRIHDYMYAMGETNADRCEADRVFLNNMLRLVDSAGSNWLITKLRRRMALSYYKKVANYGSLFFWKGKNPGPTMQAVKV